MYDLIIRGLDHFLSAGAEGLWALALIYLTSSRSSSTDHGGSISWISLRQFSLLLVLAAWTHIVADVLEHGGPPQIVSGIQALIRFFFYSLYTLPVLDSI